MATRFPTRRHEVVLEAVLAAHRADSGVLGVLLSGLLARGTAREDSDIDLLLVLADGSTRQFECLRWQLRILDLALPYLPKREVTSPRTS